MIKKTTNGWAFRVRVYDYVEGKNIQVYRSGFSTKREATEASHEFVKMYEPKTEQYSINSLFDDVYAEYLENRKKKIKVTAYYNELPTLNKHIYDFYKGIKIRQISPQLFERWLKKLKSHNLSISYTNHILNTLKGIAELTRRKYEIDLQFIEDEPPFRSAIYIDNEKKIYTLDQFYQFIETIDEKLYLTLIVVMFFSGLRLGEIRALNWSDYDGKCIS